jgi:2-dehydropantoate 2-reductase
MLAVKTWQVREVAPLLPPLLGQDGAVLTLQNGVEAPSEVAQVCGASRVIAGVCRLMSYVAEPGLIRHQGVRPRVELGELSGVRSTRASALQASLDGCPGVAATLSDDIQAALWEKLLFIAPFSALGAATRKPAGVWRHVPESRALLVTAMGEVVQLARARGVVLSQDAVNRNLGFVDRLPGEATASMQRDLLEGKPSELEAQTGAIVRLAAAAGIPVPANAFLYAALLPSERQIRGL